MFDADSTIGNYYAKFKNLPPPIDYFIVGSFVVLSSLQSYDEPTGFPFRLAVFDPSMHRPRSDLVLDADLGSDNILRISVNVTQFERNLLFEQVVENVLLFLEQILVVADNVVVEATLPEMPGTDKAALFVIIEPVESGNRLIGSENCA